MQRFHDRLDAWFRRSGLWIARHAWLVLALSAAFTAALASGLPRLGFDTSIDGFLKPEDPMRVRYDAFREQFGRDEMILVALRPKNVFELDFLRLLKRLHRDLEDNLPRLNEVTSLVNARDTRGEGDVLIVDDLLLRLPETPAELATFREQALGDPIYRDLWISDDGSVANLAIETDAFDLETAPSGTEAQEAFDAGGFESMPGPAAARHRPLRSETNAEIVAAVHEIVAGYRSPELEIWISGSPTMTARLLLAMEHDMARLLLGSMLTIVLLLALVFRRVSGVVLPLAVVVLSIVSMLGSMAFLGIDVAFGTQILPSAILAIGVGYAVHLLTSFFARYDETGDRLDAIAHTFSSVGVAITMSALTTAIGFGSFLTSSLYPLYRMGCVAPLGATLAFLYTIIVLPALLAVVPLRVRPRTRADGETRVDRALVAIGAFAHRRARAVSIASACLAVASLGAASRLEFSHNPMTWLPAGDDVRTHHDFLDAKLDGTIVMEVIVDFQRENALHDPETLRKLETLASHARARTAEQVIVHKTVSIVDVLKEIHQALHAGDPAYHALPSDPRTISQELLLFESSGSDDLEKVTNRSLSLARMTLKVGWVDATHYPVFIAQLEKYARELFGPEVELYTTGMIPMMSRTMTSVMSSAASSYLSAFLSIIPLMILLIGRLRQGLASVIPTLFPLLVTTGVMSVLGFKLDMFTILVGSIALGLAVDDTTHFVHGFARSHDRHGEVGAAIRETMRTTGRAMLFTTLVLSAGFLVFTLSELNNLIRFGAFTATALITAFVADIIVAPALLTLTAERSAAPSATLSGATGGAALPGPWRWTWGGASRASRHRAAR